MSNKPFQCHRRDCFANVNGGCKALTGETRTKPCPFFKTKERVEQEERITRTRLKALFRLKIKGGK